MTCKCWRISTHLNSTNLGNEFNYDFFGIVIRASVSAGEQAVERLLEYDKVFGS